MNSKLMYVALATVFVLSVAAYLIFPGGTMRDLAAIPAIGALFSALFQILRDRLAHERALTVLGLQNSFAIGAMPHLANVAFDKHVLF